jgi:hypothetical protein
MKKEKIFPICLGFNHVLYDLAVLQSLLEVIPSNY